VKFNNILEQALNNTALKRVRMKTDPLDRSNPVESYPYEGYIIEENEGMLRIMLMAPDMQDDGVVDMEPDEVEPAAGRTFEMFKQFALDYIMGKNKGDCDESSMYNIINSSDIQHLESFMKEQGVERDEFAKMCKLFLMS